MEARDGRAMRALSACLVIALASGAWFAELGAITVTEIMYHPAERDEGSSRLEWIELYNETPVTLNLSGYRFSRGIDFEFPHDTYLSAYSYLVVCADEDAVRAKYGIDNTIGNFLGRLDNRGETVTLDIFGGGPEVSVKYSDRGQWPHSADGTGHSLSLKGVFMDPGDNDSWAASAVMGGTPGRPNFDLPRIVERLLLKDDGLWRYLKGDVAFPAGWIEPDFDDSGWEVGPTGIGYDDGDDRTVLADMRGGYLSFAARTTVNLTEAELGANGDLVLQLSYDDGFVAYVNGVEVARESLSAAGPGTVPYDTPADLHEAGAFEEFIVPASRLRVGKNVLAVQIHNNTIGSSDASFVPRLVRRERHVAPAAHAPVPVVINEFFGRTNERRWVELYNTSRASFDLSGFHLSVDPGALEPWMLPEGSVLPPRGFLSLSEEETGLDFAGENTSIFLFTPDLGTVVDARRFDNDPELYGTSEARFPDAGDRFFVSIQPTPSGANRVSLETNLVINELMYHQPEDRPELEYIELYNRGALALDLGGFRFNRGVSYTFPPGATIGAGEYIVVARDPVALQALYGLARVHGPYQGALDNDGELVRVVDRVGNIIDEVRYSDRWTREHWADGGGSSLELMDARQDNAVASAWADSDESAKAVWEELSFAIEEYTEQRESEIHVLLLGAGEVLIDEIQIRRGGESYVANPGFESDTKGWIIEGNHVQSHRTTDDRFAGGACLRIVATGDGDTRVNRIESETSRVMRTGEGYTLTCAVKWQRGANLIYFGNYNQLPGFQFTHRLKYPQRLGTPGAKNSVAVDNLGPVISGVMHSPAVPSERESVEVTAHVTDADGIDWVRAFYRIGSANGIFSYVDLEDDGAHQDGEEGDGLYGGAIPPQSTGTRVVYYIEARDLEGQRGRLPVDPRRTHVYLQDAPLAARGFTARLIHDDVTWDELWSRRLHSAELLDATFVFNETEVYYNVGSRFRGSPWNRPPEPRMYRVSFRGGDRLRGRRAINLSRYGNEHDERTAYYSVWRNSTAAIPCPMSRGSFARVKTNQGAEAMELVEPVNRDYARLWFPGDSGGTFYKVTGKLLFGDAGQRIDPILWATYEYRGPDPSQYRWFFNHRTREMENDYAPLIAMLETMNGSDSMLDHELDHIMDVEQFLRVYAARCAHDDWDTLSIGNGQNAYFYWAPGERRMKLVPWDMDLSWGNAAARVFPDADSAFARVLSRPRWRRTYLGILNEMINGRGASPGHWSVEEMVTKFVDRNHAVVGPDGVSSNSVRKIRDFVRFRRQRLAEEIPVPREFSITTGGGEEVTVDAARIDLEGEAWVDVHTVVLDGEVLELDWITESRWRTVVPLELGENELSLLAFDVDGELVGEDSITVTAVTPRRLPTITSVAPSGARPGERITVHGTEFQDRLSVYFDETPSPGVVVDRTAEPMTASVEVPVMPEGRVALTVRNPDGGVSRPATFTVERIPPLFVRGDLDLDGNVEVADVVRLFGHLYRGLEAPCLDAGDVNDNEALNTLDAILLLAFLYEGGQEPSAPFPEPGWEPETEGPLGCGTGL